MCAGLASDMSYQTIDVVTDNGLCVVTQNRPEALNARNSQMYAEIIAAFQTAGDDDSVSALLLTSSGTTFSAGMDFKNEYQHAYTPLPDDSDRVRAIKSEFSSDDIMGAVIGLARRFVGAFIEFDKPLIGAVNGPAIGEGFTSLLHCDLVYASNNAYFWAPFARAGAAPEFAATRLAPRRLGSSLANAMIYFARKVSAEEAKDAGFVLETFDSDDLLQRVQADIQEGLALAGPPELRAQTLRSFRGLVYSDEEKADLLRQADREFALVRRRAESGEANLVREYYAGQLPR